MPERYYDPKPINRLLRGLIKGKEYQQLQKRQQDLLTLQKYDRLIKLGYEPKDIDAMLELEPGIGWKKIKKPTKRQEYERLTPAVVDRARLIKELEPEEPEEPEEVYDEEVETVDTPAGPMRVKFGVTRKDDRIIKKQKLWDVKPPPRATMIGVAERVTGNLLSAYGPPKNLMGEFLKLNAKDRRTKLRQWFKNRGREKTSFLKNKDLNELDFQVAEGRLFTALNISYEMQRALETLETLMPHVTDDEKIELINRTIEDEEGYVPSPEELISAHAPPAPVAPIPEVRGPMIRRPIQ